MDKKTGLLHVYTGNGKGKTTAAVGLAVRAKSRGLRVLFAQFMKNIEGGETELLRGLGVEIMRFKDVVSPHFNPDAPKSDIRRHALSAMVELAGAVKGFDMAVLDEFIHLVQLELITEAEAREFICSRPAGLEMVLTGRGAPKWLLDEADYATEMRNIKHPIHGGAVKSRNGIEY